MDTTVNVAGTPPISLMSKTEQNSAPEDIC
jgi:hypothetical protein